MTVDKRYEVNKEIDKDTEVVRFVSGYSDEKLPVRPDMSKEQSPADYTPAPVINSRVASFYRSIRDASAYDPGFFSDGMLFYKQAVMMADYDDHDEPGGDERFDRYYPRYRDMNERQLTSYFRLRTGLRDREHVSASCLSYIYLYCYELIAGVGVKDAVSGLAELKWLKDEFGPLNRDFERNLTGWCRDYCIYYDLHGDDIRGVFADTGDDPVAVLERYIGDSDDRDAAFKAICETSGDYFARSSYYRDNESRVEKTVTLAYREIDRFLKEHGKKGVQELCFGVRGSFPYRLFRMAPFYDHLGRKDYVYEVTPACRYRCSESGWARETYFRPEQTSAELRTICQETDRILRELTGFSPGLKEKTGNENIKRLILSAAETVLREEAEAARPKVTLDMTRLSDIRRDAAVVRDALIVEEAEETAEEQAADPSEAAVEPVEKPDQTKTDAARAPGPGEDVYGLDPVARQLLFMIMNGGDATAFAAEKKISLPVTVDSINEALYDLLGDTALEFDGDIPVVVEDYREELSSII